MAKNKKQNFNNNIEQKIIADGLNRETGKTQTFYGPYKGGNASCIAQKICQRHNCTLIKVRIETKHDKKKYQGGF